MHSRAHPCRHRLPCAEKRYKPIVPLCRPSSRVVEVESAILGGVGAGVQFRAGSPSCRPPLHHPLAPMRCMVEAWPPPCRGEHTTQHPILSRKRKAGAANRPPKGAKKRKGGQLTHNIPILETAKCNHRIPPRRRTCH